jgi:translocation and assembly module TamB
VKITFDRGFANVHITFAGLASLVKVDDLRGIPMEPLIDKYLKEEP